MVTLHLQKDQHGALVLPTHTSYLIDKQDFTITEKEGQLLITPITQEKSCSFTQDDEGRNLHFPQGIAADTLIKLIDNIDGR